MNWKQFEDDNGELWTVRLKIGVGKAKYIRSMGKNSHEPAKPHLLEFTSDKAVKRTVKVGPEKSSISYYDIEELKTLLKESHQSKP